MVKSPLILLLMLSLWMTPVIASITVTWSDVTPGYSDLTNITNASAKQLGYSHDAELGSIVYTIPNAPNASNCSETFTLYYGDANTVSSSVSLGANAANISGTTASLDLSSIDTKWVKPSWSLVTLGENQTTVNCSFTSISLDYEAGMSDIIEGLPNVGSDVGTFLKRLAPGVGAFIIILGVFGGIVGIVYAVVGVIKRKIVM